MEQVFTIYTPPLLCVPGKKNIRLYKTTHLWNYRGYHRTYVYLWSKEVSITERVCKFLTFRSQVLYFSVFWQHLFSMLREILGTLPGEHFLHCVRIVYPSCLLAPRHCCHLTCSLQAITEEWLFSINNIIVHKHKESLSWTTLKYLQTNQ